MYIKLSADKDSTATQFADIVDAIAELVIISTVGKITSIPAIVIKIALENRLTALIFNNQSALFTTFDAIDNKQVVYPVAVRGENIGDFYYHRL